MDNLVHVRAEYTARVWIDPEPAGRATLQINIANPDGTQDILTCPCESEAHARHLAGRIIREDTRTRQRLHEAALLAYQDAMLEEHAKELHESNSRPNL